MNDKTIPEVSLVRLKTMFTAENMVLGWSFLWRLSLFSMILGIPLNLIRIFQEIETNPLNKDFNVIFTIVFISTQAILSIILSNHFGKITIKKYYETTLDRFIGWSIYWRMLLGIMLYSGICTAALLWPVAGIVVLFKIEVPEGFMVFVLILAYILNLICGVAAAGWAVNKTAIKYIGKQGNSSELKTFTEY